MKEGSKIDRIEGRRKKGSPDYNKRLISFEEARVALTRTNDDLVALYGRAAHATETDFDHLLVNDDGMKSVSTRMTIG